MNKQFIVTISNAEREVKHRVIVRVDLDVNHLPPAQRYAEYQRHAIECVQKNLPVILDDGEELDYDWQYSVVRFSYHTYNIFVCF